MKLGIFGAAAISAVLVTAASAAQHHDNSKSRVIVQDGKEVTLTGCVSRNPDGGLTLTNVAGKDGAMNSYLLARLKDDDSVDDLKRDVEELGRQMHFMERLLAGRREPGRLGPGDVAR